MAITGPAPKEEKRRRNANSLDASMREVIDVPFAGAVPIRAQGRWPASTKRWFKVVTRVPHAVLWSADDWEFLAETAVLKARFDKGDVSVESALRLRYAKLALTREDRMKQRIRYLPVEAENVPDDSTPKASVTSIGDRRRRVRPTASD